MTLGGPTLFIYARSDLGHWSPQVEQWLLSVPFGFFAIAASSFAIAVGLLGSRPASLIRVIAAVIGTLTFPYLTAAFSIPLLFGIGEGSCSLPELIVVFTVLLAPTAIFQVAMLGKKGRRAAEFIIHVLVISGALTAIAVFIPHGSCFDITSQDGIFQAWPLLLSLAPYGVVSFLEAKSTSFARLAAALFLSIVPFYAMMTMYELSEGHGINALKWPQRIVTDFVGSQERYRLIRELSSVRPNTPIRIGEHWYSFQHVQFRNVGVARTRRPDRIELLHIDIPVDDIDPAVRPAFGENIPLTIVAVSHPLKQPVLAPHWPLNLWSDHRGARGRSHCVRLGKVEGDRSRDFPRQARAVHRSNASEKPPGITLCYSAALSIGEVLARNCSSKAASSAFAAFRCRVFTWPKPRIFSGMAASPTATG